MRDVLLENTERFARGLPANNALLWGARGMGKSSLVKAVHASVNATHGRRRRSDGLLKLVEIHREDIETLPDLMTLIRGAPCRFIVFCDDLSFEAEDTSYKALKAMLEGGIEGRRTTSCSNATSNRRHLMAREMMENERSTAINPGEAVEEKVVALGPVRTLARLPPLQPGRILGHGRRLCRPFRHRASAREGSPRGARMGHHPRRTLGRVAWQYVQDLAGRLGVRLTDGATAKSES